MRLADKTWKTEDEEYLVESRVSDLVKDLLESLKLDTYNGEFIIRVTVDKVDDSLPRIGVDDAQGNKAD